jgi:hypothetical protein
MNWPITHHRGQCRGLIFAVVALQQNRGKKIMRRGAVSAIESMTGYSMKDELWKRSEMTLQNLFLLLRWLGVDVAALSPRNSLPHMW